MGERDRIFKLAVFIHIPAAADSHRPIGRKPGIQQAWEVAVCHGNDIGNP